MSIRGHLHSRGGPRSAAKVTEDEQVQFPLFKERLNRTG